VTTETAAVPLDLDKAADRIGWVLKAVLLVAAAVAGYVTSQVTVHQRLTALEDKYSQVKATADQVSAHREATAQHIASLTGEIRLLANEVKHLRELLEISNGNGRQRKARNELIRITGRV
jgi:hypothetical protein